MKMQLDKYPEQDLDFQHYQKYFEKEKDSLQDPNKKHYEAGIPKQYELSMQYKKIPMFRSASQLLSNKQIEKKKEVINFMNNLTFQKDEIQRVKDLESY